MMTMIPNSHYWNSLDMMIEYFSNCGDLDREYIKTGLINMLDKGYRIVSKKELESLRTIDLDKEMVRPLMKEIIKEKKKINKRIDKIINAVEEAHKRAATSTLKFP